MLPDYQRSFDATDFRGYIRWSTSFSRKLSAKLYHACHLDELQVVVEADELGLRSSWSLDLPVHGNWSSPGVWTGLNNYAARGNFYGPFLVTFPLNVLDGRRFMVFRRTGTDRHRHFFVQYEARIPVYSYKGKVWRKVNTGNYFLKEANGNYWLQPGAIYDFVLTQPVPLTFASIEATHHPNCIPKKCSGSTKTKGRKQLND